MTKRSDIIDVEIQGGMLVFHPEFLSKMNYSAGDRLDIGYTEKNGIMIPIIFKSDEGKKLSKTNQIRFSGKQKETLAAFGSRFWAGNQTEDYCELEGDGIPVYTEVSKAVEAYISKEIVLDTNYIITYRTEFEF